MKYVIILVVVAIASAQKPNYLSGNIGQPELAYRFRTNETTTISPLGNRLGSDGTTRKIPVDARGDPELVDRLNTWPQQNKPFWLINAEAIEAQRNSGRPNPQGNNVPVQTNRPQVLQDRFSGNNVDMRNPVHDERGFDPNYEYDDFGNRIGPRRN